MEPVLIRFGDMQWEWSLAHVSLQERLAIYVSLGQGKPVDAALQALVAGLHPGVVRRRLSGEGPKVDQVLAIAHRQRALGALQQQALQVVQLVAAWCAEGWGPLDRDESPSFSGSLSPSPEPTE